MYLDASAVVKLLHPESETAELVGFLESRPVRVSSEILRVELLCVCHRRHLPLERGIALLDGVALLPLTAETLARAAQPFTPPQRALDAIHLAAAESMRDHLDALVTYDDGQLQAAETLGWAAHSPGVSRAA